jgi:hypothetical protein
MLPVQSNFLTQAFAGIPNFIKPGNRQLDLFRILTRRLLRPTAQLGTFRTPKGLHLAIPPTPQFLSKRLDFQLINDGLKMLDLARHSIVHLTGFNHFLPFRLENPGQLFERFTFFQMSTNLFANANNLLF